MTPRQERVESALGDGREICARCGATLATFADVCSASLGEACEGFARIEAADQGVCCPSMRDLLARAVAASSGSREGQP